jgi:RNA polymerase sigma-70 factor (ECF subfamily)
MIDLAAAYAEHQDAIYMFLYRRLGDRQVAEDLTSQTFEKALRFADSYEDRGGAAQAWLTTIARRCLLLPRAGPTQGGCG